MTRNKRHRTYAGGCKFRRRASVSISDRQLYRDPERGKIAGVCVGIAEYTGLQLWLVRILAVTALLFMPQIVVIAYIIAFFVLPTKAELKASREEEPDLDLEVERKKQRRFDKLLSEDEDKVSLNTKRRIVRRFKDRFATLEQRMQKLESYVTSSQFQLNKEFRNM